MKKAALAVLMCGLMALPAYAMEKGDHGKMKGDRSASSFADHILQKMDKNSDGVISMDEHEAFNANMFFTVDKDKDRELSREEIIAYKEEKRAERNGY